MRTRVIVTLFALGGLLLLVGLRGGSGDSTMPAPTPASPAAEDAPRASSETTSTSTTPESTTTISPAELGRQLAGVDELERTQPLTRYLPYSTSHFRIDYDVDEAGLLRLEVELRAILNRPEQLRVYEADLRAYKAEALEWLRSVGADPAAYEIHYRPPEAAEL